MGAAQQGDEGGFDDHAREGLDHLQAAAKEMIKAARAMLDAAEDLVDDPAAVRQVVATVGSAAATAMDRVRSATAAAGSHGSEPDDSDTRVQRIRIS